MSSLFGSACVCVCVWFLHSRYFWDTLIDADLECDALGWQFVSGCMIDAQPYSHLMDYEEECSRFDPEGKYVRKWLPLLSRIPATYIHSPWKAPAQVLRQSGVEMGVTYVTAAGFTNTLFLLSSSRHLSQQLSLSHFR